jgi:predicted dehydrogenase
MRFMDHYREAKRIVRAAEFGGLSSVTVVAGNMGMATNGLHYFEMFRYVSDERPASVTAWLEPRGATDPRGADFEDRAGSVRVVTATGKRLYLELGADQGHGIRVIYAGLAGQLVVDELSGTMRLSVREAAHRHLPTVRYAMPGSERVFQVEPTETVQSTRRVLEALMQGGEAPSGEDGRLAVAVLVAAYESAQRGSVPVSVDDPTIPLDRKFHWA